MCDSNEVRGKASFFKKNDLLYQKFSSPNVERGRIFVQLIVPQQYPKMVMKLVHKSIMAGHPPIKRTVPKVLSEFFWPGITRYIKRFCQSCGICQCTIPKGKIIKALLCYVGLPSEILTDMGTQFTSSVMKEMSKLVF